MKRGLSAKTSIIIACSNSAALAASIARLCMVSCQSLNVGRFPDGELKVGFPSDVKGKDVILVQTLHPANEPLFELVVTLHTAKKMGARSVTLVIPYLAYLRQDKRFHPGECKSNSIVAGMLSKADRIITIDPHLHRVKSLEDIFRTKVTTLTANWLLADFIQRHYKDELIIGPDVESYQWAATIAEKVRAHAIVLKKRRYSSRRVRIRIRSSTEFQGRTAVIVDDIISSGHTMIETVKEAKRLGAKRVVCLCVHGLFAENALLKLKRTGAVVAATNTVPNPVARIDVAPLLARALCTKM